MLENIGISPIIVILPTIGHSLVGWRPYPESTEIVLLETTQIVSADFENAIRSGQESFRRGLSNARIIYNEPELTLEGAVRMGLIRVIDVRKMREMGIFPSIA